MPITGAFARTLAATLAAGTLLSIPAAHAAPAESGSGAGTLITATTEPDGWHNLWGGSAVEYRTTRSNGEPVKASGAVFVPSGQPPAGGWPVMAWDHGTTGLGPGCGCQADPEREVLPYRRREEDAIMRFFLAKGYAMVAPDYLGLGLFDTGPHPYLELSTEAGATIDMVKAARAARPELSRTWAVSGASQGGHAVLGSSIYQVRTTPELDFRGTVAIDPASDAEKVLPIAGPWVPGPSGQDTDAFFVSILIGMRAARPDAQVDSYLTDYGRQLLDSVQYECLGELTDRMAGVVPGAILSRPLSEGPFQAVLRDYMTVATRGHDAPILLLINATDTTVPSPLHAALMAQFAANGVDFGSVLGTGGHTELNPAMWAAMDAFTNRIFAAPTVS
ncbi:lipase family protein [Nocardia seriolae]|uniref:lipase family protein n=1 Tax=Nocardia seriolae TaxID=37332 RepID=UPI000519F2CF|nr:lipase family protein [Nocardia seriolae]MTJ66186.1 alpha/beta hydrolase [Nocardia seriolae]MTJ75603.1 alpha/beta hydrolase [Nocardia seriolae]MTJ85899.1 alpha/beta hydrolase [Nocardia seriolae]MTK29893.1 alpha/beta hydrolase [Nocardia seriolae]MTK44181.1 alpha/beta hydrolase [Nocardia seriolae]